MPKRPPDDDGFDFVEDEDDRPRTKKRPAADTRDTRAAETDEYERPARRDDDDRPRKKRKKPRLTAADRERMRQEDEDARDAKREQAAVEWAGPIFLAFLGVAMTTAAGVILARRTNGLINPAVLMAVTTAWTVVLVPVVIVALMVIGGVMSIDYGTLKNAVRSLVAITFLVNGIYWVGNLFLLGYFIAPLIAGIVTFALFMIFFGLDPQETSTSLAILNVILWVANQIFLAVVFVALQGGVNKRDRGDDLPRGHQNQGQFNNVAPRGGAADPDDN